MLWATFKDLVVNLERTLRQGQPVFEHEILTEKTAFPMVLWLRREKVPIAEMQVVFEHMMREEALTKTFRDSDYVVDSTKWGWYPSGGIDQGFAKDRVDFIGDAGIWTTPCGWGMGFILKHYRAYVTRLADALEQDRLDAYTLSGLIKLSEEEEQHILANRVATRFLANGSASQIDTFIRLFDDPAMDTPAHPGAYYCEKLFTLSATTEEYIHVLRHVLKHFTLDELFGVFPKDEYEGFVKDFWDLIKPCQVDVDGLIDSSGLPRELADAGRDSVTEGIETVADKVDTVADKVDAAASDVADGVANGLEHVADGVAYGVDETVSKITQHIGRLLGPDWSK